MFLFVKKRNSIEPIQLVPWKSVSLNDKKKDLEAAVSALSNLKGVGPAMASGK